MQQARYGGGWHAIMYVLSQARKVGLGKLWRALRSKNTCKTCALGMGGQRGGMVNEQGRFPEVCKKSVQAMTSDMQAAVGETFFKTYSLSQLQMFTPRQLETSGRLTTPLYFARGDQFFKPISWESAIAKVSKVAAQSLPERSFFYASGRSSNEAGFLLQLFARLYGTNNVNNCSYYCHQASGVGMGLSLGTGTATIELEDLDKSDVFFLFGSNPASNHPRLMTILKDLRRRGGKVIVVNPLIETGLNNFRVPSDVRSLFFGTKIASHYLQIKAQGDIALISALAKYLAEKNTLDHNFIQAHTEGFAAYEEFLRNLNWHDLISASGVEQETIEEVGEIYAQSKRAVFGWCMGITHHVHGVANVQNIINLALLRGMVGKVGSGLLPIRGHSNVQGMGSMAVTPELKQVVFKNLQAKGVVLPSDKGMDTLACLEAAATGKMDWAFCLGGNLYGATPDAKFASAALGKLKLVAYACTTLNTGHVHGLGEETIIFPVLARDEEKQKTSQESMFNFVRLSDGGQTRHVDLRSEVELITDMAEAVAQVRGEPPPIAWEKLRDHKHVRQWISEVIPGMENLTGLDSKGKEFTIPGRVLHAPVFPTPSGKAKFVTSAVPSLKNLSANEFNLISLRSEGQFNTVVYEDKDYYRGQERRDVVLMNSMDMQRLSLTKNMKVKVQARVGVMLNMLVRPYAISAGSVAMYYPEVNALISRQADPLAKTPAFKSAKVSISRM